MVRLGQRLKDARIQRRLSIEEVSVATKIKPQFLTAIERGDYDALPSPAYAKGFVRNYADYLGLPKVQTSALFKRDFDEKRTIKVLPEGMTNAADFPLRRINLRRVVIVMLILLGLFGFLFFQYRSTYVAPSIEIKSPRDGSVVSRNIEVVGKTASSATVTINNDSVFVKDNGEFVKKITLFPGKTSIIVKAKNRLGFETSRIINLIVK